MVVAYRENWVSGEDLSKIPHVQDEVSKRVDCVEVCLE